MPSSNTDLVREIAALARLELTPEQAERLAPQFTRILGHFQVLEELYTEGVEPMTGPGTGEVRRPDDPRPGLPREAVLANAPDPRDGFFAVPKTIGDAT